MSENYNYSTRLKTFEKGWPHGFIPPSTLARTGLFFTPTEKQGDATTCFYCSTVLANWKSSSNPFLEHCEMSPECPLMQILRNTKVDLKDVALRLMSFYLPTKVECDLENIEDVQKFLTENSTCIWEHEKKNWKVSAKEMAISGFYYSPEEGMEDQVICQYCKIGLNNWVETDDPDLVHISANPDCAVFEKVSQKPIDKEQGSPKPIDKEEGSPKAINKDEDSQVHYDTRSRVKQMLSNFPETNFQKLKVRNPNTPRNEKSGIAKETLPKRSWSDRLRLANLLISKAPRTDSICSSSDIVGEDSVLITPQKESTWRLKRDSFGPIIEHTPDVVIQDVPYPVDEYDFEEYEVEAAVKKGISASTKTWLLVLCFAYLVVVIWAGYDVIQQGLKIFMKDWQEMMKDITEMCFKMLEKLEELQIRKRMLEATDMLKMNTERWFENSE